jgi:serine/threonine protein kinase
VLGVLRLNESVYGEIGKVCISRMANIHSIVDFARLKSKTASKKANQNKRSVKALACPIEHPGVIKFWTINSQRMEAYTLWWNGRSVKSFWNINSKVSKAIEYQYILKKSHMTMQDIEKILAFRSKCAKLALSLIMTMTRVHKSKILHNDISPSNILLHFPLDHIDRVYIGLCDWGLASYIIEDVPLVYGYPTTVEMERNKKEPYWVAIELFYIYGPPNFETLLEHV